MPAAPANATATGFALTTRGRFQVMPARSISTASLTFGLVSIPVRLFPATSSKSVSFHLLHAKDMSRIQQKIYCPKEDKIVDRSELVRAYEVEKDRYVIITDEELKKLEAQADRA